jgi:diamine N-acetyltransferase
MIQLREITSDEIFDECVGLKIKDGQRLFSNAYSLAEAWLQDRIKEVALSPFCIYKDDTMVGFVMFLYYEPEKYASIYRFMIDKKYQGMGYGKEAMRVVLEYLDTNPLYENCSIGLDVHRDNEIAINLYKGLGFFATGEVDEDGEMEMELKRSK